MLFGRFRTRQVEQFIIIRLLGVHRNKRLAFVQKFSRFVSIACYFTSLVLPALHLEVTRLLHLLKAVLVLFGFSVSVCLLLDLVDEAFEHLDVVLYSLARVVRAQIDPRVACSRIHGCHTCTALKHTIDLFFIVE